jgi:hypothetical protein
MKVCSTAAMAVCGHSNAVSMFRQSTKQLVISAVDRVAKPIIQRRGYDHLFCEWFMLGIAAQPAVC